MSCHIPACSLLGCSSRATLVAISCALWVNHCNDTQSPEAAVQVNGWKLKHKKVAGHTRQAVATAGSFSGVAEGTFYAANLKNNVTISANATLCAQR